MVANLLERGESRYLLTVLRTDGPLLKWFYSCRISGSSVLIHLKLSFPVAKVKCSKLV